MSHNERKTEDMVESRLRQHGYYLPGSGITVEKQQSDTVRIQKLLENASKKGAGVGRPEFLIHSTARADFLIVIECKASQQRHISATLDRYADYAVDGVLLYASFLSKGFDYSGSNSRHKIGSMTLTIYVDVCAAGKNARTCASGPEHQSPAG